MASKGRATFAKRQKEIARQERARDKSARRADRNAGRVKIERDVGDDPDVAGIVPGPQPLPYDLLEDELEAESEAATETEAETASKATP